MSEPKTFFLIHNLVEPNGKTIRENNLAKEHRIPVGTLVEVKFDEWFGDGACLKAHARLWVVKHTRDCDGTPLYSLSAHQDPEWALGRFSTFTRHGFGEERLISIEVTPDLVYGRGALEWEEELEP